MSPDTVYPASGPFMSFSVSCTPNNWRLLVADAGATAPMANAAAVAATAPEIFAMVTIDLPPGVC